MWHLFVQSESTGDVDAFRLETSEPLLLCRLLSDGCFVVEMLALLELSIQALRLLLEVLLGENAVSRCTAARPLLLTVFERFEA